MIGNFTDETFSPAPLKVTTLSDELRIATDGVGRAYAVAPHSYEAITGAGHAGNGGYWINGMTANWASTTFYKEMPLAVKDRNYRNSLATRLDTMRWEPLLNLSLYPSITADEIKKPFKVTFPRKDVQRVKTFLSTPLANTEITDVALALIAETNLGRGKATDMPASETEAESRMLDALNTTPPISTLPTDAHDAWARSSTKCRPSVPMLPSVKPITSEKRNMPIT